MLSRIKLVLQCCALTALGGCAAFTFPEPEISAMSQVPADYVLLVGKIELTPPLRDSEIQLDVPNDVFNIEEMMSNRAIIGLSTRRDVPVEKSEFLINPRLGRTFFLRFRETGYTWSVATSRSPTA